jgi:small subunit ribosomal protein S6
LTASRGAPYTEGAGIRDSDSEPGVRTEHGSRAILTLERSLREYELVVIMSPQVPDDEVPDAVERLIRRPVEERGGEEQDVNHAPPWGRRKLAYPIQKQLEGNYVVTQLRLDPQQTKELEQRLSISEEVIRHLLVRLEG